MRHESTVTCLQPGLSCCHVLTTVRHTSEKLRQMRKRQCGKRMSTGAPRYSSCFTSTKATSPNERVNARLHESLAGLMRHVEPVQSGGALCFAPERPRAIRRVLLP
jgi:hypothetical protein